MVRNQVVLLQLDINLVEVDLILLPIKTGIKMLQGITFDGIGALNSKLSKGLDYGGATGIGTTGGLNASISNLSSGYGLLENGDTYAVDFLLMGSARYDKEDCSGTCTKSNSSCKCKKRCRGIYFTIQRSSNY